MSPKIKTFRTSTKTDCLERLIHRRNVLNGLNDWNDWNGPRLFEVRARRKPTPSSRMPAPPLSRIDDRKSSGA